jgi:prolyl-tRNA editing enzyme YbaK/EbsC (Cys-tRNA(Pro) deacylase)
MDEKNITGEILHLDEPTPTVEIAAQVVGTQPEQIAKSVLFTVGDKRIIAITCGTRIIERRVIAKLYNVGRKRVRLANAEIVLETTGYPVGTVPPFGHKQSIRTLIDPGVLSHGEVFAGGGAHNALLRINPQIILDTTQAQLLDLHTRTK